MDPIARSLEIERRRDQAAVYRDFARSFRNRAQNALRSAHRLKEQGAAEAARSLHERAAEMGLLAEGYSQRANALLDQPLAPDSTEPVIAAPAVAQAH